MTLTVRDLSVRLGRRDVLTGTKSASALATSAGVAPSPPSSKTCAPMTTWSGTTTMPRSAAWSAGMLAVESVTMTVRGMSEG